MRSGCFGLVTQPHQMKNPMTPRIGMPKTIFSIAVPFFISEITSFTLFAILYLTSFWVNVNTEAVFRHIWFNATM